ncbi:fucolectin-like [Puntigrus tetrazona]|nr:fucolectin-like [Puntigrus tetrazona]
MNLRVFYKSLMFLLGFFSVQTKAEREVNVATWGTANQSTLAYNWSASNALDGLSSTCTHTQTQTDPWWMLDLMKTYSVNRVTITNRLSCCGDRINGAEIRIGNNSTALLSNPV